VSSILGTPRARLSGVRYGAGVRGDANVPPRVPSAQPSVSARRADHDQHLRARIRDRFVAACQSMGRHGNDLMSRSIAPFSVRLRGARDFDAAFPSPTGARDVLHFVALQLVPVSASARAFMCVNPTLHDRPRERSIAAAQSPSSFQDREDRQ
jgi:hypothetical protein